MKLTVVDEVASTNEIVKNALREGKAEGLVVRARRQNGGYGRQGRIWDSPEGGLYMSMLLRPDVAGSGLATLSLVVGLSVQRALAALAAPAFEDGIQLKWPNDVVYMPADCERADEYRKLCGISMEACGGGVCVGIGINVFPPDIPQPVEGRNVPVYLADLMVADGSEPGSPVTMTAAVEALPESERVARREEVICDVQREVLARVLVNYGRWRELGFQPSLASYGAVSFLDGRPLRIENASGETVVEGEGAGVDERGRLLVRSADRIVPVASGEAHVIPLP
ncbi:biotin--[acetyl-CoA-carboxylase] ligase [Eggerthellaceae bacterium 24-137]